MKPVYLICFFCGLDLGMLVMSIDRLSFTKDDFAPWLSGLTTGFLLAAVVYHFAAEGKQARFHQFDANQTPGGHLFDEENKCRQCGNRTTDDPESCKSVQLRKGSVT